jgi:DNA repair protein RadC
MENAIAEIQLSYKSTVKPSQRAKITSSREAYNVLLQNWNCNYIEFVEQFKVLLLNRANKVLGIFEVSSGRCTGTIACPRLIFVAALKANSCGVIVCHNHPSGNLQPSHSDVELTKKLKDGGKLLEVSLLDHLIITSEAYYSFADEGMI